MIYTGSCHCGAVEFEVEAPKRVSCVDCNCSICAKSAYLHLIVPKSKFRFIKGEDYLVAYTFGSGIARHTFCPTCGVKPVYIPRSNPDGYDVNVRCLSPQPLDIEVECFDGQHWEQNADSLRHLSRDD